MTSETEIQALKLEAAKAEKAYWEQTMTMAQKMVEHETWKLVHAHWTLALALRQVEVLRVPDGNGVSILEEAIQAVADLLGEDGP